MKYFLFIGLFFSIGVVAQQPKSITSRIQTKQELMAWIAQEIKENLYTEKFKNGTNTPVTMSS